LFVVADLARGLRRASGRRPRRGSIMRRAGAHRRSARRHLDARLRRCHPLRHRRRGDAARLSLRAGGRRSARMIFVHPAPGAVGKVDYSYTNNGENGPPPRKITDRLITGMILGGILFIAEILAFAGLKAPADWFLPGFAACFVLGSIIGWFWPTPKILTL